MDFRICGQDMITLFLRENKVAFSVDEDGQFWVKFDVGGGRTTTVGLHIEGDGQVFVVRGHSPVLFTSDCRGRLLEFADEWNRTRRWPKAFTHIESDGSISLMGETSWPLNADIAWALFCDFANSGLTASVTMFKDFMAHGAAPTPAEMNTWLDRTA